MHVIIAGKSISQYGELAPHERITLCGEVEFSRLPETLRRARVGLIPFADTPISCCADPLKLYQYLACGLSVLAPPWLPVLRDILASGQVLRAHPSEWPNAFKELVQQHDPEAARTAVERHTWDARAQQALDVFRKAADSMNVLFIANTADTLSGELPLSGGERQLLGLKKALETQGHRVRIANIFREELPYEELSDDVDVVHVFSSGAPKGALLNAVAVIKRFYRKPVVMTPVWWPRDAVIQAAQRLSTETVMVKVIDDFENDVLLAELCRRVDMLLPNSVAEYEQIRTKLLLGVDRPCRVVHNAVDLQELDSAVPPGATHDYVLCVGRIELRKNQHTLIEAMHILARQGQKIPLVLIGSFEKAYTDLWRSKLEDLAVQHIPQCSPSAVITAMKGCRVYVQPSFYETPGLASMEAAAVGAPVVVGSMSAEKEYFSEYAWYCSPFSAESIAEAIGNALEHGPHPKLREHIRQYTYARAAQEAIAAYQEVIS